MKMNFFVFFFVTFFSYARAASCPFNGYLPASSGIRSPAPEGYGEALAQLNYTAVKEDLEELFTDSKSYWPADYGHYGPLFVRLAWHCSGSYRISDGRGGCDGGRQRFDPERSWADNTNLDKARKLLAPIKQTYGLGLSWGDLFILAGTTAIESMGGPVLGFCGGRIDDADGSASVPLGPTAEQRALFPCAVNGSCVSPLGSSTVGLIYVNPEGPMGVPDPDLSRHSVRDTFQRMAMNDSETVALIGGGHAFGKTHGACTTGAGPDPQDDPSNPWPGTCTNGSFTSGFEGPWTSTPITWDNMYYNLLINHNWTVHVGYGGHNQWQVLDNSPLAPNATDRNEQVPVMMLTTDVSLTKDPEFAQWVQTFAKDQSALDMAFSHAWYKLVSRDMGPQSRCAGPFVPEPQPWQNPLPANPDNYLSSFAEVRKEIVVAISANSTAMGADTVDGKPYFGAIFTTLAYHCARTFRQTDYQGGCDGARIRFSPEKDWDSNKDLDKAVAVLQSVKEKFGERISWADLIVYAGTVALEEAAGISLSFCPGRSDALDGTGSQYLNASRVYPTMNDKVREHMTLRGLTSREMVALHAHLRSPVLIKARKPNAGSWTNRINVLSNEFYVTLLNNDWTYDAESDEYVSTSQDGQTIYMSAYDMEFKYDPEFASIAMDFATDNSLFLQNFGEAWVKLVNADRYDGPLGNLCGTPASKVESDNGEITLTLVLLPIGALIIGFFAGRGFGSRKGLEMAPLLPNSSA